MVADTITSAFDRRHDRFFQVAAWCVGNGVVHRRVKALPHRAEALDTEVADGLLQLTASQRDPPDPGIPRKCRRQMFESTIELVEHGEERRDDGRMCPFAIYRALQFDATLVVDEVRTLAAK